MADPTTTAGTAPAPTADAVSPAPAAAATPIAPAETGAGTVPEAFLAELGLNTSARTQRIQKGNAEPTPPPTAPAADAQTADGTPAATDTDASAPDPDEAEVAAKLQDERTPKWVSERLSKNAAQKKELKAQLEAVKAEKEAAEQRADELAAKLPTVAPSAPLAHLDSTEKFEEEGSKVRDFIGRIDDPATVASYRDYDPDTGTSQSFENDKAYAKHFLKNEKAHAQVLKDRAETTEAVKKAAPTLFDGKSEDFQFRAKLHTTDPRTLPDYEQIIADAARGRRMRLEEQQGKARYTRVDLAAAKAATKPAEARATKAQEAAPVFTVPGIVRPPVTSHDAPNPKEAVMAKARTARGVSIEEMMEAGLIH